MSPCLCACSDTSLDRKLTKMIRRYCAWLFRRPVAAFAMCISLILVLQIIVILSWNWGSQGDNIKYRYVQTTAKAQQKLVKYRGKNAREFLLPFYPPTSRSSLRILKIIQVIVS